MRVWTDFGEMRVVRGGRLILNSTLEEVEHLSLGEGGCDEVFETVVLLAGLEAFC